MRLKIRKKDDFDKYRTSNSEMYYEETGPQNDNNLSDEWKSVFQGQNVSDQWENQYLKKAEAEKRKDGFAGIAILVWFIASIVYMCVMNNSHDIYKTEKICLCIGQLFLVFGLIFLVASVKKNANIKVISSSGEKKPVGAAVICILIGIGIFVFGGIKIWGSASAKDTLERVEPGILAGVFLIVGVGMLVQAIQQTYVKKKRCTMSVNVVCDYVKTSYSGGENRDRVYSPVWKGYVSGAYRTFECGTYTNKRYCEGQEETILVNPDNPSEYIDSTDQHGRKVQIIIGLVFAIIGAIVEYATLVG